MKSRLIAATGAACLFAVVGTTHSQGLQQEGRNQRCSQRRSRTRPVLRSLAPMPRVEAFPPLAAKREICDPSPAEADHNATNWLRVSMVIDCL
jgi:hypothetical protein